MIATRASRHARERRLPFLLHLVAVGRVVQPPLQRLLLRAPGADGEDSTAGRPQETGQVVHVFSLPVP